MFISAPAVFLSLMALTSSVAGGVVSGAVEARDIEERAIIPQGAGDASEFLKRGDGIVDVFPYAEVRRGHMPSNVRAVVDNEILEKRGQLHLASSCSSELVSVGSMSKAPVSSPAAAGALLEKSVHQALGW
ncbi:hypothetical protein BDN67DRAFT_963844 [Paxillus ammoniavirescens]|nr:hypothetical protein BDN67DRAFT_963844 [Paxillus ammoniavirescens]